MSQSISELKSVGLVKSFLAKLEETATPEEVVAWRTFHRIHDLTVRKVVRRLHKRDTVDDVAQEVWRVVCKKFPKFRLGPDLGSVGGWVFKIALDTACKHARQRSRRAAGPLTSEMADELPDSHLGPEIENKRLQDEDELGLLIETLRTTLSKRDHRIAVMHFRKGRSAKEIAGELKLTEGCVTSVLQRVVANLRDLVYRRESAPS